MSGHYTDDDDDRRQRGSGSGGAGRKNRHRPFASVLLVALLAVPALVIALRFFIYFDDSLKWLASWLVMLLFGVGGGLAAIVTGTRAKRDVSVIVHVVLTIELFTAATSLGVVLGWYHDGESWWRRLVDIVHLPGAAVLVYFIGSIAVAFSWFLPRLDSFRASTGESEKRSGIAELLKWPKNAKVRQNTIEADEFAVTAIVDHPGTPVSELRAALPGIDENPGVIRGRSSIVAEGEHGGQSRIRIVHSDPHKTWRVWPGLSHPGGSYSHPINTSYYSTGEKQWYSFVRTPEGLRSEVAPDFVSPNGTFKGSQGMTRAGKSGEAAIELAEIFSRRNVVVIYVDTAKLLQNAAWCLDFCELAAGSKPASGVLFKGLRRLGELRSVLLGEAGHREYTDASFDELGLAWIHIFADEFDVAKQGEDIKWLATKGASLGIRLSLTLPRAHGEAMSTDVRGAVGMWAQFGISQDYDKAFALSKETMEAGANPEQFGARVPGVHYLDQAPGIDPKMYPIDCRSYQTRQDFADLRRAVEAARATFTPATLTPQEIEVLGDVAQICKPSVVRGARVGMDDDNEAPQRARTKTPGQVLSSKAPARDMQQTMELNDEGDDDMPTSQELAEADDKAIPIDHTDILRTLSDLGIDDTPDPERPIEQLPAGQTGGKLIFSKPVVSGEESVREFDAALVRMAGRGIREFSNKDVIQEMRVVADEAMVSKRFRRICDDGEHISPPGLTIERVGRGRFMLTYLAGVPVGADTHSE